jgi:hypothetical protein
MRTDSVNRGSSISLFTLESVVLALFARFFLVCIVKCSHRSFAESVLNSSHDDLIEIHNLCPGLVLHGYPFTNPPRMRSDGGTHCLMKTISASFASHIVTYWARRPDGIFALGDS